MPADTLQTLNELVKVEEVSKQFPKLPKPDQITVSEITDSKGEDAYQVVIFYPDSVRDKDLEWDKISPVVDWIRKQIFEHRDGSRWPYFRFGRKSDLMSTQQ